MGFRNSPFILDYNIIVILSNLLYELFTECTLFFNVKAQGKQLACSVHVQIPTYIKNFTSTMEPFPRRNSYIKSFFHHECIVIKGATPQLHEFM